MKKIKLYKKIPCLLGKHRQAIKPIKLEPDNDERIGQELYFCERCLKILAIGHFPPTHPNCYCALGDIYAYSEERRPE